jgi:DNA-binding NarL/FixJ family response regulator
MVPEAAPRNGQQAGNGSASAGDRPACGPILVVNQSPEQRSRICGLLAEAGYETLEGQGGQDALAIVRRQPPALVVLDVPLDDFCGYAVCRTLKEEFADEIPVIFVSGQRTESVDRVAGLLAGADEYVAEPVAPDEFLLRVRRLVRDFISMAPGADYRLTPREFEVLALLAHGLRQKEIALELFLSPKTVGAHTERIYRKLGVRSRAEAVAVAYRDHLVPVYGPDGNSSDARGRRERL